MVSLIDDDDRPRGNPIHVAAGFDIRPELLAEKPLSLSVPSRAAMLLLDFLNESPLCIGTSEEPTELVLRDRPDQIGKLDTAASTEPPTPHTPPQRKICVDRPEIIEDIPENKLDAAKRLAGTGRTFDYRDPDARRGLASTHDAPL